MLSRGKWYEREKTLGVDLIEPKTAIEYLEIKLCIANKRVRGEQASVINIHEEISAIVSGFPNHVRRKSLKIRHRKEG